MDAEEKMTDRELLLELKIMMTSHLKHHEKWEKFIIGIFSALVLTSIVFR